MELNIIIGIIGGLLLVGIIAGLINYCFSIRKNNDKKFKKTLNTKIINHADYSIDEEKETADKHNLPNRC